MNWKLGLIAGVFGLLSAVGFADADTSTSGTTTFATTKARGTDVRCTRADCLSDASGNVVATTDKIAGKILRVTFNPDGGSTVPTAAYDVTLQDEDGFDVLCAHGANLSSTTTTSVACVVEETTSNGTVPIAVIGTLSLAGTNVGNAKGFVLAIYWEP